MTGADAGAVERAFVASCRMELRALKPGNVHVFADGHAMSVADFERSALAAATALADPDAPLGSRILEAVRATRAAVACNTNLGILLLCAPIAQAALAGDRRLPLRTRLRHVLGASTVEDAAQAFAAIRLASPGGLGEASEHDVRAPATVTLTEAMAAAAGRDRIAAQYASGFADVFETGISALAAARARKRSEAWAVAELYLVFLAGFDDTHIVRKSGPAAAGRVRSDANWFLHRLVDLGPMTMTDELLAWDGDLKAKGLNPGTSADLTVATVFASALADGPDPAPAAIADG